MMKLEPIEPRNAGAVALSVLAEGFPGRSVEFWRKGLRQAAESGEKAGVPTGYVLLSKGAPAGVILTFGSLREGRAEPIVNLSAWYVRETHRFLAPIMLKSVCSGAATYTDLTPTPQAARLSQSLGFRPLCGATAVAVLPLNALLPGRGAVREWRKLQLSGAQLAMAAAHEAMGCTILGVETPEGHDVLIIRRVTYFRMAAMEVVYGKRKVIKEAAGPIARSLLARGAAALLFDCERREEAPSGTFFKRSLATRLIKGESTPGIIDYAWSELPILNP
jgi:hypothetical protein